MAADKQFQAGTGRRKTAVATVRLIPGKGRFQINGRPFNEYFTVPRWHHTALSPLRELNESSRYDMTVNVKGGGISAQAEAVSLGIARAMVSGNEELKTTLKKSGLLTRDDRIKERKKYGLKKARKAPQFSKR